MAAKGLRVLHFNDAYEVDRTPYFLAQWGKRVGPDTIPVFSGDILNPSFMSISMKGHQFVPFFKGLPLTAAVLGNHEFDWGEAEYKAIQAKAPLPWLVANLRHKVTGERVMGCPGDMVKEVSGYKVGLVGLVDQAWKDTCMLDPNDYILQDPLEAALAACAAFKAQGCDFIIALTHMEFDSDRKLLASCPDLDLILGGHNHVYQAERQDNRLLIKSGCDFKYFTELEYEIGGAEAGPVSGKEDLPPLPNVDVTSGVVLDESAHDHRSFVINLTKTLKGVSTPFRVTFTRHKTDFNGPYDADLKAEVDQLLAVAKGDTETPVAFLDGEFNVRSSFIRMNESPIGNAAADLVRLILNCDVLMVQSGHIRSERVFPDKYVFRMADLMAAFPLNDEFSLSRATGRDLDAIMEEGVQHVPHPRGSYPNISGMRFQYHPSYPPLDRIMKADMTCGGLPVDYEAKYTIATLGWITNGGDGYTQMINLERVPVSRVITCLDCFKMLLNLPASPENRKEFALAKPLLDQHTLDELIRWRNSGSPAHKTLESLSPALLEKHPGGLASILPLMCPDAAERLLMYRIPKAIVEVEGHHVFSFSNAIDGRVKRLEGNA